jgi:phosphoribosyl 1,2-cyclic phosphate phosphodiesterase
MEVTFLGTGTSIGVPVPTCTCDVCHSEDARNHRLRPSVWLRWGDSSVLVDTAPDLREQALRYGIHRIDAVLFTHGHADHVLGMDDLRLYNWRQKAPVPVYGNNETLDAVTKTFWYVFDEKPTDSTRPSIDRRTVSGSFSLLGRQITPVPLLHGKMPILGYRIGAFAYLTDVSHIPDASYDLLCGLDVLVLSALRERPHPNHFSLDEAIDRAGRIGASRTFLTHMSHEMHFDTISAKLPVGVDLAYDGLSFQVD